MHLLFDLDGTLVDSLPGITYSASAALSEVAPDRTIPDLRPYIGPPIREIFRRALGEEDPAILERLNAAFRRSYDSEGWAHSVPYPSVVQVLAMLRRDGNICHVVTNKPLFPTRRILDHLQILPVFERVVAPESRQPPFATKTEAALHLKQELGLQAPDAVFVGDSPDDASAAAACGFRFAAATYGYGSVLGRTEHPCHIVLAQFSELPQFLSVQHTA